MTAAVDTIYIQPIGQLVLKMSSRSLG